MSENTERHSFRTHGVSLRDAYSQINGGVVEEDKLKIIELVNENRNDYENLKSASNLTLARIIQSMIVTGDDIMGSISSYMDKQNQMINNATILKEEDREKQIAKEFLEIQEQTLDTLKPGEEIIEGGIMIESGRTMDIIEVIDIGEIMDNDDITEQIKIQKELKKNM